jgi:hypothetical protein
VSPLLDGPPPATSERCFTAAVQTVRRFFPTAAYDATLDMSGPVRSLGAATRYWSDAGDATPGSVRAEETSSADWSFRIAYLIYLRAFGHLEAAFNA